MRVISIKSFFPAGIALLAGLLMVACGEDEKRASAAADWLKEYSSTNPPNQEWQATNVGVDGDGQVVMDVLVADEGQVNLIQSRTPIEQSHIVRMACPPKDAEIWTILSPSQVLWINLLEETAGGLFKSITGASCKR